MYQRLTPHFARHEVACRCGCGKVPVPELLERLEQLRLLLGHPVRITSGARCEKHNAAVGGAKLSQHVTGKAVDVACVGSDFRYRLIAAAIQLGFRGIGLADTYIHLDIRPGQAVSWFYGKRE